MHVILILLISLFLPSCPTEDSTLCYWDSTTRGNGEGVSFIALTDDWHIEIP